MFINAICCYSAIVWVNGHLWDSLQGVSKSTVSSIYVRSCPLDIVSPCKSTLLLFHEKPVLLIWRRKARTLYEKSKCTSHFSSQLHIWTIFLVKSLTKWHQDAITILLQRPQKSPTKALSYNYSYLQYNAFRCFYDTEIPISTVNVMLGVYNIVQHCIHSCLQESLQRPKTINAHPLLLCQIYCRLIIR